jgi:hypothetical protein
VRRSFNRANHWLYAKRLRSPARLTLPQFLGIGAQKAGTSWLHTNLQLHPDAFLPPHKELHYFDEHFDESLASYAKNFAGAGDKLRGEITPAYSILPVSRIRYIRSIMPDVRLIFLMRNPIERAWSHALMTLVTHAKHDYSEIPHRKFIEHFQSDASLQRSDYEMILDNWLSVFDSRQLFIGYFEDIALRPVELLQDVCRHVGLREDVDWSTFPTDQKILPGPGIPMPQEYRDILRNIYLPYIWQLRKRLGSRINGWLA